LQVVVGVREGGASWKLAQEDGWVPGKTLFPIKTAAEMFDFLSSFLSIYWFFLFFGTLSPLNLTAEIIVSKGHGGDVPPV